VKIGEDEAKRRQLERGKVSATKVLYLLGWLIVVKSCQVEES
jgi:hypothetical protein